MIAKVIPAVRLPRAMQNFDYLIEGDLDIRRGSIVTVPWRGKPTVGIVMDTGNESKIPLSRLKPIAGRLTEHRLPEDFMDALEWAADRYLSSLGAMAKCFLPTPPKRRRPVREVSEPMAESEQMVLAGKRGTVRLYGQPQEKWQIMEEAVERCLKTGHSVIVLTPHQDDVQDALAILRPRYGDRLAEIHGQLAAGALWRNWEATLTGQAAIVVGSRLAAMAPVRRLGMVVILEGDSPDHKQYDQNPRYDARTIAKIRTEAAGAELVIMTQSPRTEDLTMLADGFEMKTGRTAPAPVILADISAWGREWNGPLAPASLDRIRESLQKGKNALIYHNRQGTAGALACADCRQVVRCPNCSLAMPIRRQELHCTRCGKIAPPPEACPDCGSPRLRPIGWGTTAVESFLRKNLPDATIVRIDAETGRPKEAPTAQIIIGSRGLVHDLAERHGGNFGAVIVTAAEDLLRYPGFRTTEEAWGLVQKLRYLATQGETDLIIQTLNVEDPRVRSLTREAEPFLRDELNLRQQAHYPPAGRLVLVVARGRTEAAAAERIAEAHRRLAAACRGNGPQTVLSRPFRPSQALSHGYWRQALAIRAPELGPALAAALRQLPEEFIIEPDPETPI